MPRLKVTPTNEGESIEVGVWDDTVRGVDQGVEASKWLTRYLSKSANQPHSYLSKTATLPKGYLSKLAISKVERSST